MFKFNMVLFLALITTSAVRAEILFEGYYKVTQFKKHIGFLVLRHEIDDKTKNFKTMSFIKLGKNGFDMTETYTAISDSELAPLSVNYVAVDGKKTKTIEVTFKKQKMTGTVTEDGKKTKVSENVPKGVFLSSALYYVMLKSKDGLKTGSVFDYKAITEEGPVLLDGTVSVEPKSQTKAGLTVMKINNKFAGSDYDNFVNSRGEVISAITAATSIESELVANKNDATDGIKIGKGMLEKVFGNTPEGHVNALQSKGK